ncbi:MAG: carboxypeptidase-like regulatory domain-containing protein [Bacteroidaceae bacterium]|nr:carboxypeptidase-like regulatory domain-containing protein [Bacteroidaceae bacterium]
MLALSVKAQTFSLHGRVTDNNGLPVEFCTVAIPSQGKMTMTNLKGEYSLTGSSADSVAVRFSMIGFQSKTRIFRNPKGKLTLTVQLSEDETLLSDVLVTEERRQTNMTQKLELEDVKFGPSTTGNAVEEMIQQQAGVSSHNELSSQYNVRGGSFDENSVYINNVEIYRPFLVRSGQQEGLSIINPDMVERVDFSSGGFEPKFGDKMSSALNITYKKPRPFEASVMASLLGGSVYLGFMTKKFSWQNGVRYKTNELMIKGGDNKAEYDPNFFDYQTYLTFEPTSKFKIELLGDISLNNYNFTPKSRETKFGTMESVKTFLVYFDGWEKDIFRTYFGSIGLTYKFNDKTSLQLLGSAFFTNEQEKYDIQGQYWLSEISETEGATNIGVGTYAEHARNYLQANVKSLKLLFSHNTKKHQWLAGVTYKMENISEQSREYEMRDSAGYTMPHTGDRLQMIYSLNSRNELKANRVEAFVQDTYKWMSPSEKSFYTLTYGLRYSHWNFNNESLLSPRVSFAVVPAFNNNMTFRFASGIYYQAPFYKELRDTITENGITVAQLNRNIKSQRSIHFIAGMDFRFKLAKRKFKFTSEAYYKLLSNIIPYSVNNVKIVYDASQQVSGYALGLDLKLYGEFVEGTDSWISFSLMRAMMKMDGKTVPMPTDQRYAINLYFTDYFPGTDRWKVAVKIAFADGLPFGAPHRKLSDVPFRASPYRRVDVGMSYRLIKNLKKKAVVRNLWLGIDGLNILGINNVNSYYWVTDITNHQFAVPNYLTGRTINGKIICEF